MNRRQFIKRAAMVATAVAVAPMAALKAEEFATGGVSSRGTYVVGDVIRTCSCSWTINNGSTIWVSGLSAGMNGAYTVTAGGGEIQ